MIFIHGFQISRIVDAGAGAFAQMGLIMHDRLATVQTQLANKLVEVNQLKFEMAEQNKRILSQQQEIEHFQSELNKSEKECHRLASERERFKTSTEEEIEALRSVSLKQKSQIEDLKNKNARLKRDVDKRNG